LGSEDAEEARISAASRGGYRDAISHGSWPSTKVDEVEEGIDGSHVHLLTRQKPSRSEGSEVRGCVDGEWLRENRDSGQLSVDAAADGTLN